MRGALPNGAHPWIHAKLLDAAIEQVPAPYHPGGRHGQRFWKKNTNKTQLLPSFLTVDRRKKLNNFKTRHEPSTYVLVTTIPDPNPNATIPVEDISYILSYQT